MNNPIILKAKKRVFKEAVQEVCDIKNLPLPEINFDGTDEGGGDELAHSHPELYKICISERQLKMQNSVGLRETAYHEMTHLIGLIEHGHQFEKTKNELISKGWRPRKGSGTQFISGEQVNDQSKWIRDEPERLAKVNEDSALLKFLEGRSPQQQEKPHIPYSGRSEDIKVDEATTEEHKKKGKLAKSNKGKAKYTPMNNSEIEKSRSKLGINVENKSQNKYEQQHIKQLTDAEQEELNKKAYENMDTGFGGHIRQWDSSGKEITGKNPKTSQKKRSMFDKIKEALGIDSN